MRVALRHHPSITRRTPGTACCLLLIALWLAAGSAAADYPYTGVHPDRLKFSTLHFSPPEPVKRVLPNGLTLYLLEDRELPLVNAAAYVRTGSIYDPPDKVGLAELTGMVMRTGGAGERTGDEIDAALEFVGGQVEISIGAEYGTASVSALRKDTDTVFEVLSNVLRSPAFRQDKLELAKQQMIEGIRRKNDQPSDIADRVFAQAIYGEDSPWAREPNIEGVEKIGREDLRAFHARFFAPGNTLLAVAGDMSIEEMVQRIERWFGDWESRPVELPDVRPVPDKVSPQVILVPKETNQANIRIGHLGIPRHSPDQYAVRVMNYILGTGGFTARLMREVRSRRGLAYGVWGRLGEGRDRGLMEVIAETKVESTPAAIESMRQVVADMVRAPVTTEELSVAREALLNSFIFRYQSAFQIASQRALLDLLGYPPDYLATFPKRIAEVTAEDIRRVAGQYLHPEQFVAVVVGPPDKLGPPPTDLGPVRILPLETPR